MARYIVYVFAHLRLHMYTPAYVYTYTSVYYTYMYSDPDEKNNIFQTTLWSDWIKFISGNE